MLDPIVSLAFSVQSNKGVYALLLGSGLSSAGGIPTGWAVTLDLIRQSAAVHSEDCEPDPAEWFRSKFEREPDYSGLLDGLGKTPSDRANILARYFEPTEDDLREGRKAPTAAHKAIARLVAKGYFRVIVTTNFDRLLERALEAEGISPTVVSSADSAKGSLPLAHTRCTLLKIHGDYRDTRIKNTETELRIYGPEFDRLLDRIFDEYGLVVCGWSAAWDEALRNCISRCSTRRFASFWAAKGTTGAEARDLIAFRQASEIAIDSADKFFVDLETKIDALERYSQPHPLSKQLAVASLKKFIVNDQYRIELRDLVMQEAERQVQELSTLPVSVPGLDINAIFERVKRYEVSVETLVALFMHTVAIGVDQITRGYGLRRLRERPVSLRWPG
jgi:SIR2-like domain